MEKNISRHDNEVKFIELINKMLATVNYLDEIKFQNLELTMIQKRLSNQIFGNMSCCNDFVRKMVDANVDVDKVNEYLCNMLIYYNNALNLTFQMALDRTASNVNVQRDISLLSLVKNAVNDAENIMFSMNITLNRDGRITAKR